MAANTAFIGEELKYLVQLTASGFSMADDDFKIEVSCGSQKKTYEKSDLIVDGQGKYYLAIDTSDFRKGDLYATVTAYVPDEDFDDGVRTEMFQQKLLTLKPV